MFSNATVRSGLGVHTIKTEFDTIYNDIIRTLTQNNIAHTANVKTQTIFINEAQHDPAKAALVDNIVQTIQQSGTF